MSSVPRYPSDIGYAGLRMAAEEYLALGETQERYELIDGVVVMSPSPSPRHQLLVRLLLREMESLPAGRAALIVPDVDVLLSSGKVYRPDLVAYAPGKMAKLPERFVSPPDLVIEILSPGSKPLDLITKRDDYETFGVGEYWVVDPADVAARVWRRAGAKMLEVGIAGDTIECKALPGLRVDLAAIRRVIGAPIG